MKVDPTHVNPVSFRRFEPGVVARRQVCALAGAGLLGLLLGGCKKEDFKMEEETRPLGMAELYSRVALSGMLGRERSLPIPVKDGGRCAVAFFYYDANVDPTYGLQYGSPDRMRRYTLGGSLLADEALATPSLPDDRLLGTYKIPEGYTQDTFLALRQALFRNMDALVPSFAAGSAPDSRLAAEVLAQFRTVAENGLWPAYEQVGADFFAWLRAAAGAAR